MSNVLSLEYISFRNRQHELLFLSKFNKPKHLTVWTEVVNKDGGELSTCKLIPVLDVTEPVLKDIKVWDLLDSDIQNQVKEYTESDKVSEVVIDVENKEAMKLVRKARRARFEHFPKEIECVKCKTKMQVNATQLAAKLDRLNTDIEKYVLIHECQVCSPSKGRKKKADRKEDITLKCHTPKCENIQKYPHVVVEKAALKKNLTMEKFIDSFYCQSCKPTRGRKKGQKLNKVKA